LGSQQQVKKQYCVQDMSFSFCLLLFTFSYVCAHVRCGPSLLASAASAARASAATTTAAASAADASAAAARASASAADNPAAAARASAATTTAALGM